jgi:leucyl aminopeptidase (aminopeptidase T)
MPTARRIVEDVLGVHPGEQVTIVTDWERPATVTAALTSCMRYVGAEVSVVTMSPRDHGGIDPPPPVGGAMWASQVVVLQTSFATTHTRTFRETLARGGRICEFWGITEDMMVRGGLTEDPAWLEKTSLRLAKLMDEAGEARVMTSSGTDLRVDLTGRKALPLAASARNPGSFCSLPAGESAIAPVEGTAAGKIIGPYLVEHREIGRPREPLELSVQKGNVTEVYGGIEAHRLERLLAESVPSARNIAEFAIGINRRCRVETGLREAKKAWGTAHIGIGDSKSIGGNVTSSIHIDFILLHPTVWLDGREVARDGKLLEF